MDERLRLRIKGEDLSSNMVPVEEQPTSAMEGLYRDYEEKLIPPKFSLPGRIKTRDLSAQFEGMITPPAIEKVSGNLSSFVDRRPSNVLDNNRPWKPGTFGFREDTGEAWMGTSALPQAVSPAITPKETVNTDVAPNAQKTGQSVIIRILSWAIPTPIVFLVTALLTRYLGPTAYGEYSLALTFFAAFALLSGTGMDQLFVRRLTRESRAEWGDTLGDAIGTRLVSTAASAIAAVLLVLVLPMDTTLRSMLLLGSVWLFFSFSVNTLVTAYSSGFIAEQRIVKLSLLTMMNRIVTSGLVVFLVLLRLPLLWVYALIIYSDCPFFIILLIMVHRRFHVRIHFNLARIRSYLLSSLPLTGHDALAMLNNQADIFLLIILTGPLSVGFYALATKLTDPLLSVVYAYLGGLYPLLCVRYQEGREQFSKIYQESVRIVALLIIPLAIFISVEASSIVTLFGGQRFAPAALPLKLLMWATTATFLQQLATRACTAANLERKMPYISGISVGVNIIANLVLIPYWQFVGAAAASLLSSTISLCLFTLMLRRQLYLLRVITIFLRVLVGNLPMLLFMFWQQHASFLIIGPIAFVITIVSYFATRVLSIKDIFSLKYILFVRRKAKDAEAIKNLEDTGVYASVSLTRIRDVSEYPTSVIPIIRI